MKYALLIYLKPGSLDELGEDEREAISAEYMQLGGDPRVVGGEQLKPIETATTRSRQRWTDADDRRPVRRHEGDLRRLLSARGR